MAELLDHGAEAVILSRGRQRRLETCPETFALLEDRQVMVVHEDTGPAIAIYNHLANQGGRVAALIHTTC